MPTHFRRFRRRGYRRYVGVTLGTVLGLTSGACAAVGYPSPGGEAGAAEAPAAAAPAGSRTYAISGRSYVTLPTARGYEEEGLASWYGEAFAGRPTASGEIFDPELLTAAHRTLPLPTTVEVTNLDNGRTIIVRVNDRGPFHDPGRRILDLSRAAAQALGMLDAGVAPVRVRALEDQAEERVAVPRERANAIASAAGRARAK